MAVTNEFYIFAETVITIFYNYIFFRELMSQRSAEFWRSTVAAAWPAPLWRPRTAAASSPSTAKPIRPPTTCTRSILSQIHSGKDFIVINFPCN